MNQHQTPTIVVVGGVAGGMSFAARARRLSEQASIIVLEKDPYVSYANCGLPYYLAGDITERDSLVLHTPDSLGSSLNLDVRVNQEVLSIDPDARTVQIKDRQSGTEYSQTYDTLVLSTGAKPIIPPIAGVDLPQVQVLRTVMDVDRLRTLVDSGARRAVVAGAGFIGLEVAEALTHQGLQVTIVDLADQVLPPLDKEMACTVEKALHKAGVEVHLSTSVTAITPAADGSSSVTVTTSDGHAIPADMVLLSVGVRPESSLASTAGIAVNARGAIVVNDNLQTSIPDIYAVGDAIEVIDAVTGQPASIPLAGPANRQGRAAANHLFNHAGARTPVLGTAIVRVFDTVAATTGRNEKTLHAAGIDCRAIHLHPGHHAGYYPGVTQVHLKLLFAPDGTILGAQATGEHGVDKRIDIIATAMAGKLTVQDLADLELSYAPPFGSAKDPINMAGFIASNLLAGDFDVWRGRDMADFSPETVVLDVRSVTEYNSGHLPNSVNIPHTQLRERLSEIPTSVPIRVYCASGFRSYLALRILRQSGWDDVQSLSGGLETVRCELPELV